MALQCPSQVSSPWLARFRKEDLLEVVKAMKGMLAGRGNSLCIWTLTECL
jgi:hypothetical protein